MNDFFLQLSKYNNSKSAILYTVEPYCSNYQPHSIVLDLTITVTTLADDKAQAMNFNKLIKVSENQVKVAEQLTRDQANSQLRK